jgi:hypothetical protein
VTRGWRRVGVIRIGALRRLLRLILVAVFCAQSRAIVVCAVVVTLPTKVRLQQQRSQREAQLLVLSSGDPCRPQLSCMNLPNKQLTLTPWSNSCVCVCVCWLWGPIMCGNRRQERIALSSMHAPPGWETHAASSAEVAVGRSAKHATSTRAPRPGSPSQRGSREPCGRTQHHVHTHARMASPHLSGGGVSDCPSMHSLAVQPASFDHKPRQCTLTVYALPPFGRGPLVVQPLPPLRSLSSFGTLPLFHGRGYIRSTQQRHVTPLAHQRPLRLPLPHLFVCQPVTPRQRQPRQ